MFFISKKADHRFKKSYIIITAALPVFNVIIRTVCLPKEE